MTTTCDEYDNTIAYVGREYGRGVYLLRLGDNLYELIETRHDTSDSDASLSVFGLLSTRGRDRLDDFLRSRQSNLNQLSRYNGSVRYSVPVGTLKDPLGREARIEISVAWEFTGDQMIVASHDEDLIDQIICQMSTVHGVRVRRNTRMMDAALRAIDSGVRDSLNSGITWMSPRVHDLVIPALSFDESEA